MLISSVYLFEGSDNQLNITSAVTTNEVIMTILVGIAVVLFWLLFML